MFTKVYYILVYTYTRNLYSASLGFLLATRPRTRLCFNVTLLAVSSQQIIPIDYPYRQIISFFLSNFLLDRNYKNKFISAEYVTACCKRPKKYVLHSVN